MTNLTTKSMFLTLVFGATSAVAHDFDELKVARFKVEYDFLTVFISDTVKDKEIVCAGYNQSGDLVVSGNSYTDNLATEFLAPYGGNDIASVKCVFN